MHEFYQVLGVRSEAADEEIKTAFRSLAKQLHPDLHPADADTEQRFQDVLRAYETLSDRQSRMAYDAGLKSQRLLRRWHFRANAMTVVAVFSLTVSVGLHWGTLSRAIFPAGENTARLASNESHGATSNKAEGTSSPIQGASFHAAAERGDAAALNKSAELNTEPSSPFQGGSSELAEELPATPMTGEAPPLQSLTLTDLNFTHDPGDGTAALQELNTGPSSTLQDRPSTSEPVDGSSPEATTAEASSLKSLALVDLDLAHAPSNETIAPQRSVPQVPTKAQGGSGAGWWVILGSINVGEAESATTMIASGVRRASSAAHRCGMGTFNDFSSKFRGFAPGYMVVVIGPFADKRDAAKSQQQVNGCVSGTYVKYAQHLSE